MARNLLIIIFCYLATEIFCSEAEIRSMLNMVNEHRQANGLSPYCFSVKMNKAAAIQSKHQATINQITHTGPPDLPDFVSRFKSVGVNGGAGAENVAMNMDGSLPGVFKQWTDSAGHNRNMLGNYKCFGFSKEKGQSAFYFTQTFGNCDDCGSSGSQTNPPPTSSPPSSSNLNIGPIAPSQVPTASVPLSNQQAPMQHYNYPQIPQISSSFSGNSWQAAPFYPNLNTQLYSNNHDAYNWAGWNNWNNYPIQSY